MTARELLSLYQQWSDRWVEDAKAYFPMESESDCSTVRFGILILLSSLGDMNMADSREISFLASHWHFAYVEQLEDLGEQVHNGAPLVFPHTLLGYIVEKKWRTMSETEFAASLLRCAFTLKKLQLSRPDKEQEEIENAIARLTEPWEVTKIRKKICGHLNSLLKKHPLVFDANKVRLKHGPGAINAKVSYPKGNRNNPFQKWEKVAFDPRIEYMCRKYNILSPTEYIQCVKDHSTMHLDENGMYPSANEALVQPHTFEIRHQRVSKLVTVPKTRKKPRVIATEQPERQMIQQGLQTAMRYAMRTDPWWARRINFHDPVGKASRCLDQSMYATIDLSAASDGVRTDMVKMIFSGTDWLIPLLATRTTYVEYHKVLHRITAFGTMGTATTFPVECVVFLLVAQLATNMVELAHNIRCLQPVIFGDDIIIDVRAYALAVKLLEDLGFQVNLEKSYCNFSPGLLDGHRIPLFREACGNHRYKLLIDVKPLYFKRAPSIADGRISYDDAAMLIALYNQYKGDNLEYSEFPLTCSVIWLMSKDLGLPWSRYTLKDIGFTPTRVGFFGDAPLRAMRSKSGGYLDGYSVAVHSVSVISEIQWSSDLGLSSDDFDYVNWLYRAWYTWDGQSLDERSQDETWSANPLHDSFLGTSLGVHACERVVCRKHSLKNTVISQTCHI
jgi:hypothetical protein